MLVNRETTLCLKETKGKDIYLVFLAYVQLSLANIREGDIGQCNEICTEINE